MLTFSELAGIFNIRTVTQTRLLKLTKTVIKNVMILNPEVYEQLIQLSLETRDSFVSSNYVKMCKSVHLTNHIILRQLDVYLLYHPWLYNK